LIFCPGQQFSADIFCSFIFSVDSLDRSRDGDLWMPVYERLWGSAMNWINVVIILLLTSLATMFALSNMTPVHIAFAGMVSGAIPVYVPVFIAFIVGFAGGMLSLSFSRQKHKQEIRRLRRDNERLQQEVDNLRNFPLQDEL